jgi:hypothetical protein
MGILCFLKEEQGKTIGRLRRSELCDGFGIMLAFYMLEKFLSEGLGENFFKKFLPNITKKEEGDRWIRWNAFSRGEV